MITKINNAGPDIIDAHGWQIQRGYVYRCDIGDVTLENEDGDVQIGYHGNDVPPCGADYLMQEPASGSDLLVISCESDQADIDRLPGVTLTPVKLEPGDRFHDGTWQVFVLDVDSDGETTLAGKC